MKHKHRRLRIVLLITVFCMLGLYFARDTVIAVVERTFLFDTYADWEFAKVRERFAKGSLNEIEARGRLIEVAHQNPGTAAKVGALAFLAQRWPKSVEGKASVSELPKAVEETPIDELAKCFERTSFGNGSNWKPFGIALMARVEREPAHPRNGRILSTAAQVLRPTINDKEPSVEMIQIAGTIQTRYATSPDLVNFCEVLSDRENPHGWMRQFEPHVRHILEVNQKRIVKCAAHFALATIIRAGGIERQEEAKKVYEEFLANFDGRTESPELPVEQQFRQWAERELKVIAGHGLGRQAPKTEGFDLNGDAISLSDYRGRVVLLSFWATWCGPCLRAIPHERELVERFDSKDFAILGMNADDDLGAAKAAAKDKGMTWRSLHLNDRRFDNKWTIGGYPTFYLVDREGVIVRSWFGEPSNSEFETAIASLISPNGQRP